MALNIKREKSAEGFGYIHSSSGRARNGCDDCFVILSLLSYKEGAR